MVNENNLAKAVAASEGKLDPVNVAQIKEVIRITLDELARSYRPSEVLTLLERHADRLVS